MIVWQSVINVSFLPNPGTAWWWWSAKRVLSGDIARSSCKVGQASKIAQEGVGSDQWWQCLPLVNVQRPVVMFARETRQW